MLDDDVSCAFEPTPGALAFGDHLEAGRLDDAFELLEQHWLELWYAFDPSDLRRLLEKYAVGRVAGSGLVQLAGLTGAEVRDLVLPRRRHGLPERARDRLGLIGQRAGDLRVRGRAVASLEMLRRCEPEVRALRGVLVDTTDGEANMWLLQMGISALLAGDLGSSRSSLLLATAPRRPVRFPFLARDAALKLALAHALAGDVADARQWWEQAQAIERTNSWVEALVDDTGWLVDYLCCLEGLELDRAEEMRRSKPSPLAHLEFWSVALHAQVQHLVLTRRGARALDVCEDVAAAGLPMAGADGWQAVALDEARLMCRPAGPPRPDEACSTSPRVVLARRRDLFAVSLLDELTVSHPAEALDSCSDLRAALALRLLRAQALIGTGRGEEGWSLLVGTLSQVLERGLLTQLCYLSPRTLDLAAQRPSGQDPVLQRAAALVEEHDLPLVEVVEPLDGQLSPAEVTVLRLLRQGRTRQQMAEELYLSPNTVKTQLASAYRKLRVKTRAEAVVKAKRLGI